ncbi:MAG: ThuA domain-containing protein [Lachnospiraceae bacterium]|nr:ThuA domain-containing protein [Lachnospiraceae bacterium]
MKALFYGSEHTPYHPMEKVGRRIQELLPALEVEMTDREAELQKVKNGDYAVCFLYADFEQPPLSRETAAALLIFAAQGGGIFGIHGGIAIQNRPELGQLIGGIFTGHPPYEELPMVSYKVEDTKHPLTLDVKDFSIPDELYLFDLPKLEDRRIFLSYEEKGVSCPAGWTREYGLGRVIYLCCGHNVRAFEEPMLEKLLKNGAAWLTEKRRGE